ncbi:MAG TPA: FAD-dependent thymidylate synthase [Candidatus Saccharimonadales bacterium]|nr:FAD-dependent thymidylate synthase [Candidatus Saccharimonadales bacterium]
MKRATGTFIVIEGTDGSGKATQFALLAERLAQAGYQVATFDFPQYDKPSSYFVTQYLNGNYGSADEVGPYTASLFYALDRFEAAPAIRAALDAGKVVIANRFTGSNMAHQGTKFRNAEERRGYFIWLDNLEFEMLRIPRPDMSFVLRVPAEIAQTLVDQKDARTYTDKKRDIHEADLAHLQRSVEVYDDLAQLFPKDFQRIDCVRDSKLLDVETIQAMLWGKISPLLPPPPQLEVPLPAAAAAVAPKPQQTLAAIVDENPFVHRTEKGELEITKAGHEFLEEAVTDTTGKVYAFTDKLPSGAIAAALADIGRRAGAVRTALLDTFAEAADKDKKLLQSVIDNYEDDSVRQLVGQYIVVEDASILLATKLEQGRLATYAEQDARHIAFETRDAHGDYRYYTPRQLNAEVQTVYRRHMDRLFDMYAALLDRLTAHLAGQSTAPATKQDADWQQAIRMQARDVLRPILPAAAQKTVGLYASGQAIENLIVHLMSDELPEARWAGADILREARKADPGVLDQADAPEHGGALMAYRASARQAVAQLAKAHLPESHATVSAPVTLTDIWPRNELDIVPDMLYEHSGLSLASLRTAVDAWPYDRKLGVFEAYIGQRFDRQQRPGRALEKAHYSWDILCDYDTFRNLQRHRMIDDLEWQQLTPRFGYDVPALIEEAGLTEQFEACFELSLVLYSYLQEIGHPLEAQYATLLGHRMRWKVTCNAREALYIFELHLQPNAHPGTSRIVRQMYDALSQVHPLTAEAMRFARQTSTPELTRASVERYNQFKLSYLDTE